MTTPAKTPAPSPIEILGQKHARIIELLGQRLTAQATTDNILDNANQHQIATLLACSDSMAESLKLNATAEAELEQLARELIPDDAEDRSIETPLGTIKLTRATALASPDDGGDEAVIALVEDWANGDLPKRHAAAFSDVGVVDPVVDFIRVKKSLNREALECLPDPVLTALRLRRVRTVKFSITNKKLTAANAKALLEAEKAKSGKGPAA